MEKLNQNAVALAFGITMALVYVACLVFVAIFPLQTVIIVENYFMHGVDISSIAAKNVTLANSLVGLVAVFFSSIVAGYILAWLYNWFGENV